MTEPKLDISVLFCMKLQGISKNICIQKFWRFNKILLCFSIKVAFFEQVKFDT